LAVAGICRLAGLGRISVRPWLWPGGFVPREA